MTIAMIQTSKSKTWKNEAGLQIPYNRTTAVERLMEKKADKIISGAIALNVKLRTFKDEVRAACQEVYEAAMREKNAHPDAKGNFTFYSFDRTVKVEVSVNERIDFDDAGIQAAKQKLDEFLNSALTENVAFAKELVASAFSTSRGKLDAKKVLSLLTHRGRITDPKFQAALDHIEKSIRRPDSKAYFRVSAKTTTGEYRAIDLNFSSI